MYYRVNGIVENYDKDTPKQDKPKQVFPIWLLILIIGLIIACCLWLLFCVTKKNRGQDFGFQFY